MNNILGRECKVECFAVNDDGRVIRELLTFSDLTKAGEKLAVEFSYCRNHGGKHALPVLWGAWTCTPGRTAALAPVGGDITRQSARIRRAAGAFSIGLIFLRPQKKINSRSSRKSSAALTERRGTHERPDFENLHRPNSFRRSRSPAARGNYSLTVFARGSIPRGAFRIARPGMFFDLVFAGRTKKKIKLKECKKHEIESRNVSRPRSRAHAGGNPQKVRGRNQKGVS